MDINKLLLVPSPYLITPVEVVSEPLAWLMAELWNIDEDNPRDPYWETTIGNAFLNYRRKVITHFWRTGYDSQFIGAKIPRQQKDLRITIKAEAELWESVIRLLERMYTLCFLWNHPAILLGQIINEKALVMFNFAYFEEGKEIGATKRIKQFQSQNRSLEALDNPFKSNEASITYQIIQKAIELADLRDGFRRDFYMKVVRNRMSLVACLIAQKSRIYNQKKMLKQGRKRVSC
jgi:hypothetical protein